MTVRRLWSAVALLLSLLAIVLAVDTAIAHFPSGLAVLACVILAGCCAWLGICRRGAARAAGLLAAVLFLAGAVALVILEARVIEDAVVVLAVIAALGAAREAFQPDVDLPPAERPSKPVLFYNPKSGGGKAERFHLADEARKRGIDPIELQRGQDLEELVRSAVAAGANGLAMAGGDGSQAIVAMVAAELDLPYACIPAGTRNHFALDLGVDRDDVVGALDAFVSGGERRVDLAEVNERVFVNNVSLGLYAEAVQQPGYREAKLHTLLETVPDSVGPDAKPPELLWDSPEGEQSAAAVLISNNAYRLGRVLGSGTRPRLDKAVLGVTVLAPTKSDSDGAVRRRLAMEQWTTPMFDIASASKVAAGIDGEAIFLDPPLRFRTRPGALRVRIAPHHPGASPSALEPDQPWRGLLALASLLIRGAPPDARDERAVDVTEGVRP